MTGRMQFCGANSKQLLAVVTLVLLTFCEHAQCQVEAFDCYLACNFEEASQPDASCDQIERTTECFGINSDSCLNDESVNDVLLGVFSAKSACDTDFECPNVPPYMFVDQTIDLERADVTPEPHSCAVDTPVAMSQCSMFTYSHLRPFQGYRSGLETCTVPGEWYLLKHSAISVIVESVAVPGSNLTRLTKVNVTFSANSCIGESSLSYVATDESPLPLTLTNGQTPNNSNSALQLKHATNSSVVTLLAVWINTTVVIRRYGNALSVVVQLPGDLSFRSEGLCRGCPRHAYFNVTKTNIQVTTHCPQEDNDAILPCFLDSELVNQDEFDAIMNNTYLDYCLFDLFKTESIDSISMLKAVGRDSRLLPERGFVPVVIIPTIDTSPPTTAAPGTTLPSATMSPSATTLATTTRHVRTSTVPMTTTENNIFNSASTVSQLNCVTLSVLLLCVALAQYLIR